MKRGDTVSTYFHVWMIISVAERVVSFSVLFCFDCIISPFTVRGEMNIAARHVGGTNCSNHCVFLFTIYNNKKIMVDRHSSTAEIEIRMNTREICK